MATTRKKAARKAPAKRATKKKAAAKKKAGRKKGEFGLLELVRNPVLASIGAFSLAEEGLERLVAELIDRGEANEREGKKIVEDYRKRTKKTRKDFEFNIDKRIAEALKSFRLPTKKDVDGLNRKIARLEKRIDQLLAQRKAGG